MYGIIVDGYQQLQNSYIIQSLTVPNIIETFATAEHLTAHANSIKVRFENK